MEEIQEKKIRINGVPYRVETYTEIKYEQVLKVAKLPFGSSVVYINTKRKANGECGYLTPGEKVKIEDGLDISAFHINDLFDEEAA